MADLPDNFWVCPNTYTTTMSTKDLKEVLLKHDGRIIACSYLWNIKSKRLGPGVYRVYLTKEP